MSYELGIMSFDSLFLNLKQFLSFKNKKRR
jgi:hypothetical protein